VTTSDDHQSKRQALQDAGNTWFDRRKAKLQANQDAIKAARQASKEQAAVDKTTGTAIIPGQAYRPEFGLSAHLVPGAAAAQLLRAKVRHLNAMAKMTPAQQIEHRQANPWINTDIGSGS